jgi:hypothetical protein
VRSGASSSRSESDSSMASDPSELGDEAAGDELGGGQLHVARGFLGAVEALAGAGR